MSFSILFPTNEYATSNKSPEEIQRLTLPSDYSLEQVLAHLVAKGSPAQMPFLFANFPRAFSGVLGFVCERAPQEESESQVVIAESLLAVVEGRGQREATGKELSLVFDACLECLNNLHSPANTPLAAVVAAVLARHPDAKQLLARLEERAVELGRASQPLLSRIAGGRLASLAAGHCGRALRGELVEVVKRVASEAEAEARKVWLGELFPRLLARLDLEFMELHFQERLFEAVWDPNEEVSLLALETVLRNAASFSPEEQSSRILKLFIDSLTAKSERTALVAASAMGQVYQRLQGVLMRSEASCIRFWQSLVEVAQTKSEKLLNCLLYNLYGILQLAAPHHRVDPLCDLYLALFYSPLADKRLLVAYFHRMAALFPNKAAEMREVVVGMLSEATGGQEPSEDGLGIVGCVLGQLHECVDVFVEQEGEQGRYFEGRLCEQLLRFLNLLLGRRVSSRISDFFLMVSRCLPYFPQTFLEQALLPRLYACLRAKAPSYELLAETVVRMATRDGSAVVTNGYVSRVSSELSRSPRSFERETALLFYYYCSFHLSIEAFREYKLGEKYLALNNDKAFKVRAAFLTRLPRIYYFLTKEERVEYGVIVARLPRDDPELLQVLPSDSGERERGVRGERGGGTADPSGERVAAREGAGARGCGQPEAAAGLPGQISQGTKKGGRSKKARRLSHGQGQSTSQRGPQEETESAPTQGRLQPAHPEAHLTHPSYSLSIHQHNTPPIRPYSRSRIPLHARYPTPQHSDPSSGLQHSPTAESDLGRLLAFSHLSRGKVEKMNVE